MPADGRAHLTMLVASPEVVEFRVEAEVVIGVCG
jgi:hypothetical protein